MTAIITSHMKRFVAEQIIESLTEPQATALYIAVGRTNEWPDEPTPANTCETTDSINAVWNEMHFMKRVTGNDMSLICRRINWVSNTVYDAYAHDVHLANLNFYVLTSDYNVYKCLDNNMGVPSTIEPTYTSTAVTNRTADGYLWKYLFTLTRAQRLRFLTDDWMPVRTLINDDGSPQYSVQEAAIDGAIDAIKITNAGQGFSSGLGATVTITGDGTGATANIVANNATNTVQYIIVTSRGDGYTWATVSIESSNTSLANGATGKVMISPYGGHGSNPAAELDVRGLMVNVRLKGDENQSVKVGNEFRRVSIIRDPVSRATDNVASNTILNQVMTLTLSGSGGSYNADEWVYQGASLASASFKGRVINFDSNVMEVANTYGTPSPATITGATSAAMRFLVSYTATPATARSGDVLYIDHRAPITRSNTQTENIQIPIIF